MFRKYDPSGARTAAMLSATRRNHPEYSSGGTGVKPLSGSYSRCEAYGGDVMQRLARAPANRRCTTSRSRLSPQTRRCLPMRQVSADRVTGSAGASGISSSASAPASEPSSALASSTASSLSPKNQSRINRLKRYRSEVHEYNAYHTAPGRVWTSVGPHRRTQRHETKRKLSFDLYLDTVEVWRSSRHGPTVGPGR